MDRETILACIKAQCDYCAKNNPVKRDVSCPGNFWHLGWYPERVAWMSPCRAAAIRSAFKIESYEVAQEDK